MSIKPSKARALLSALLATAIVLSLAGSAQAKLTGAFTVFNQCPYTDASVERCLYSVTESGEVVLGNKKVPIVNPVTLQGGVTEPVEAFGKLVAAKNGITLSKAPQPVPGGLAGLVNCKEISNFLLRISCEATFENGLTGVNSTLELAKSPSDVLVSQQHLAEEEEVALKMPVKVHLENPFLGSSCFIGSSSSPVIFNLTTGETAPPGPNKPITGSGGKLELLEEARILKAKGLKLVDNAWSAPGANGCGGVFSFLIDPIINASVGVPAAAGRNTAILNNTAYLSPVGAVKENNDENP